MMPRHKKFILLSVLLLLVMSAWAAAVVTSTSIRKPVSRNMEVVFDLKLNSAQSVSGVNGEMRYDSRYLSQPRVSAGAGASGFIVIGNEVEPGRFRFVAYKSPTANMDLSKPILIFALRTGNERPSGNTTKITYTISAASKPDGASFGSDVAFADVIFDYSLGVQHWHYY